MASLAPGQRAAQAQLTPLDRDALDRLRTRRCGVVARHQVLGLGGTPADFRRLVRHGATMGLGVCVDHTGPPTWAQRAWAAVLAVWPAALAGRSAVRAEAGPGWRGCDESAPIEVAVDRSRNVTAQTGGTLRHVAGLDAEVRWNLGPPRTGVEEATLDVACCDVLATVEASAASVRARCTTAQRLLDVLAGRSRVPDRALLHALLVDLRWRQVFDRPCRTAGRLGRLLSQRGWAGSVVPCGPGCAAVDAGAA